MRLGLCRKIKFLSRGVFVRLLQQRQVVRIASGNICDKIVVEPHDTIIIPLRPTNQRDAGVRKSAEVDRFTAVGSADRNGHMRFSSGWRPGLPFAQNAQPPAKVPSAIAAWRPVMRPHRQINPASGALQFTGDLRAGRSGADDHNGTRFQLVRVAIGR